MEGRRLTVWRSAKLLPLLVSIMLAQTMALVQPAGDVPEPTNPTTYPSVHWSTEMVDPEGSGAFSTLALDDHDRPHIAHFSSQQTLRYSVKEGGTWGTEVVDDSDLVGQSPSIAIDSKDRIHISYAPRCPVFYIPENPPPPDPVIKGLRYAVKDGGSWKKEVVDYGVWAADTSLALDALDRPHISYSDWDDYGTYYAHWNGTNWKRTLLDGEGALVNEIVVDSSGNPHIAYERYGNPTRLYYASWDGTSWQFEDLGNASFIVTKISMVMDDLDRPHITWRSKEGLRYATWDGEWKVETLTEEYTFYVAIALHKNSPRIVYEADDKVYGELENGTWNWEIMNTTEPIRLGFYANHPLGVDSRGVPHVSISAYVEGEWGLVYLSREALAGPIANAGPDQVVYEGDVVQFNAGKDELSFELTTPVRVNDLTEQNQTSRSMAIDSKGDVLVAWRHCLAPHVWDDDYDMYLSKSTDGGESFSQGVRLTKESADYASHPYIAIGTDDNIYVVWQALRNPVPGKNYWEILLGRSLDGGQTFEDPIYVNETYKAVRSVPTIAIGANDTLYVAWTETPDGDVPDLPRLPRMCVAKSEDRGQSFGPCVQASGVPGPKWSQGSSDRPKMAAHNEHVYVVWHSNWDTGHNDVFFSRSLDGGDSFEPQIQLNEVEPGQPYSRGLMPRIEVGPEGNVYVIWHDTRNAAPDQMFSRDVYFSESTNGGQAFEPAIMVNDHTQEYGPAIDSLVLDPEGNPYTLWTTSIPNAVFVDRSTDKGMSFGHDFEVMRNESGYYIRAGTMSFSSNSTLHIIWGCIEFDNPLSFQADIYYSHSTEPVKVARLSYEWDFDAQVDGDNNGNYTDDVDATAPTPTWTYGDNGHFTVTLKVTDELGNWDIDTMNLTVLNVAPEVTANYSCTGGGPADIMLRIAGEKWHDVTFAVLEDGNEIFNETLMRVPGSPNEQMIGLEGFALNGSRSYAVVAYYTPEDDPVNGQIWGATPAWIILRSGGNETARLHHTFNVRHPGTWLWRVDDLGSYLPSRECTFTAYASDPGSDDLTFTWDFGDGTTIEHVYYNDGIGPDPFPSPEINPANAADETKHSYASAGSYTVTLTVTDDDGGVSQVTLVIVV